MATYTITTDSKKAQILSAANSTWTLDPNVTVEVYGIAALTVQASATKSTVNVLGELICSGESVSTGIGVLAAGVTINIGADARIFATAGIQSDHAVTVNNKGLIAGVGGIYVTGGSVTNSGLIISSHSAAVQLIADGTITNLEDGKIFGAMAGLGAGFHTYINKGFVGAATYALSDGDGASKTINTGTISGDVMLGDGDDVFDTSGGETRGTVEGSAGDDTYIISSYLDIFEDLGFGTDTVKSSASYTLAAHLEILELLGSANINGTGNALSNTLYGNTGNNVLKGAAGDDLIRGGSGDDVLIGGAGADQLFGDDGADTASYAGATKGVAASLLTPSGNTDDAMGDTYSSIENLTGSSYADTLTGDNGANLISGGAGDDALYGGLGNDTLLGGAGADQLIGGDGADTASYAGATIGVVASLLNPSGNTKDAMGDTYSSIENLTGSSYADTLIGNNGANLIDGGAGDDTLYGGLGNDILLGGAGADQLIGGDGADAASYAGATRGVVASLLTPSGNTNDAKGDTHSSIENLTGSSHADTLTGNTGANRISGGAGNDTLYGGLGADQLLGDDGVDTASYAGATRGVVASLLTPSGNTNDAKGDTYSSIENLTGSSHADTLTGNIGANRINGGAGNDTLYGGLGADQLLGDDGADTASYAGATTGVIASLLTPSGNTNDAKGDTYSSIENLTGSSHADTLTGNTGANRINGGAGNDTLYGGLGADQLFGDDGVDTASYAGATTGVIASLLTPSGNTNDAKGDTYSSIENLTGSSHADTLTGNTGANRINGGAGNDTLYGGLGADQLFGDDGVDTASYAGATRGVVASLLTPSGNTNDAKGDTYSSIENLTGSSHADELTGNTAANLISGGSGNDMLYGGLGADVLIGGAGLDTFVFDTKLGSTNIDTVDDFVAKDDAFRLDDDIFAKAGKLGYLATSAFWAGTKAHDADDRIIYDKATGKLFYDADGNASGAAVQFALLDKGLSLTAADFYLIA